MFETPRIRRRAGFTLIELLVVIAIIAVAGGRPAAGRTDAEGHYELQYSVGRAGALPGEHEVTISTLQDGDPDAGIEKVREKVPAKYNTKSELKATVEADDNVIDFALDAK